jgi:hypothetical protein
VAAWHHKLSRRLRIGITGYRPSRHLRRTGERDAFFTKYIQNAVYEVLEVGKKIDRIF